ncbi:hypothetical protein ACWGN9_38485 [Streptomyces sp. NPDC055775]
MLAIGLVAWVGVQWAIGLSVIPVLLAAVAIVYAIRRTSRPTRRDKVPLKIRIRPILQGDLGRLMGAVAAFEVGNVTATLLILRATDLLTPDHSAKTATTIAPGLCTAYNAAATIASVPAGRLADRLGGHGPVLVLMGGWPRAPPPMPCPPPPVRQLPCSRCPSCWPGSLSGRSRPPSTPR